MQRRTLFKYALTLGSATLLAGCGFKLRGYGTPSVRLDEISVEGPFSPLRDRLIVRLDNAGTEVNETAPWILTLGQERVEDRRFSLRQAGNQQHEMTLTVTMAVQRRSDGAYRLPSETITVRETYLLDDDNLLAAGDYREEIRNQLRDKAARHIIQRLNTLIEP
ncbi:LPS assembly lipoprotein LptE [Halomonas halocynthiae]|uniref:LPS-assembly lipoprotein LptE n=1 Tax=Halomonas halocynthiae TaxID=176290 RepID=UPI0003F54AF5|nr:LPS assembly lipoprotein LptE [Halomonas halocynthiae]